MQAWEAGPGGGPALKAYRDDAGVWTIGYGDTKGVIPGMEITTQEAERRLSRQLEWFGNAVELACESVSLNQHQFDALVSFTYNIGITAFRGSSALVCLKKDKFDRVGPAMELYNKVRRPDGRLVVWYGLVRRRAADRAIFDKGDYNGRP